MQFFDPRPPEALEIALSKGGPDQNFEYGIFECNQILRAFAFIQIFVPRLPWGSRPSDEKVLVYHFCIE